MRWAKQGAAATREHAAVRMPTPLMEASNSKKHLLLSGAALKMAELLHGFRLEAEQQG